MSEDRYSRQLILPELGVDRQERLSSSRAVIVGCGALGSFQAQILARAGVGRLDVIDRDFVERSNLQRQILFTDDDANEGLPKAVAAERSLRSINPDIEVNGVVDDLNAVTADGLLRGADVVTDGTDNFETRYLLNDWCVREGTPWVYGGVIGTSGLMMPILPGETACLRCVFESPPPAGSLPTCETAGVLGSVVAVVAGLQVTEVVKILSGQRERLCEGLLRVDGWRPEVVRVNTGGPRVECPVCGRGDYAWLEQRAGSRAARLCGREAIQLLPLDRRPPTLEAVEARLGEEWRIMSNEFLLRAWGDDVVVTLFRDGRVIIEGTTDEVEARRILARFVGT